MDQKPPCDWCSSYDFSCTGACEKPMAENDFYYPMPPGVFTANTITVTANTVNTVAAPIYHFNVPHQSWLWDTTNVHCAHPVLGFVTDRPGSLAYGVREEPPRYRTVLFQGQPKRLYWPRLAFFAQENGFAAATAPLFVYRVDGDAPLAADTPLRQFPFSLWNDVLLGRINSYSHVSQIGAVCFDNLATALMKGLDPESRKPTAPRDAVDVFWSSGFSKVDRAVLDKWTGAAPAQVLSPGFFPDADWSWNKHAPAGLTVGAMMTDTKNGVKMLDSRTWTG